MKDICGGLDKYIHFNGEKEKKSGEKYDNIGMFENVTLMQI